MIGSLCAVADPIALQPVGSGSHGVAARSPAFAALELQRRIPRALAADPADFKRWLFEQGKPGMALSGCPVAVHPQAEAGEDGRYLASRERIVATAAGTAYLQAARKIAAGTTPVLEGWGPRTLEVLERPDGVQDLSAFLARLFFLSANEGAAYVLQQTRVGAGGALEVLWSAVPAVNVLWAYDWPGERNVALQATQGAYSIDAADGGKIADKRVPVTEVYREIGGGVQLDVYGSDGRRVSSAPMAPTVVELPVYPFLSNPVGFMAGAPPLAHAADTALQLFLLESHFQALATRASRPQAALITPAVVPEGKAWRMPIVKIAANPDEVGFHALPSGVDALASLQSAVKLAREHLQTLLGSEAAPGAAQSRRTTGEMRMVSAREHAWREQMVKRWEPAFQRACAGLATILAEPVGTARLDLEEPISREPDEDPPPPPPAAEEDA
jgi:hypothetical protein